MTSEEQHDTGHESNVQPIPEKIQDISTEEIVEAGYGVAPTTESSGDSEVGDTLRRYQSMDPPGRNYLDDSIDASSENPGGSPHEDAYSTGYESSMATRIGDEDDGDTEADRLRELHDGRHHSDGQLSTRQAKWDKTRTAEALSSSLPLAQHEREKVIGVVETIDFSKFGQQRGLEPVTLGVVAVVVDERHRQMKSEDPDIVQFTDVYRDICDRLGISMSDLSTVKEIVRNELDGGAAHYSFGNLNRDPLLPEPTPADALPGEYWNRRSAEAWVNDARMWEKLPDEYKQGIPEEYRSLIRNLQQWKPWKGELDEDGR